MNDSTQDREQLWTDFLNQWPIEAVKEMTLQQYSTSENEDTFTYWLEFKTISLGSIKGGSSFKFGVYHRKNTEDKENASGLNYSGEYGWYQKYGDSAEAAFQTVKSIILNIIDAAQSNQLDVIDRIEFSEAVKWKIAFLYQDRNHITILPIYSKSWIKKHTDNSGATHPIIYTNLLKTVGDQTVFEYKDKLMADVDNLQESDFEDEKTTEQTVVHRTRSPKNKILFGAAGTGKTYATITEALKIIDPDFLHSNESNRKVLKDKFDELAVAGQINFVTFHQSFSYEEFVEGIKPKINEQSQVTYEVSDGMFKMLCKTAVGTTESEINETINLRNDRNFWKMSLGRAGFEEDIYDYCIDNDLILLGWGESLDYSDCKNRKDVSDHMKQNGLAEYLIKYPSADRFVDDFKNKFKIGDIVIVSDGNLKFRAIGEITSDYALLTESDDLPRYVQKRSVKWLKKFNPSLPISQLFQKDLSQQTLYNLRNAIVVEKLETLLKPSTSIEKNENKKYVLIIDEINRGNISRIFGELITLIEDSKREGQDEALTVTLPYSKEPFSVPSNVYIIGTMNSSDRSLTGIDLALRRRFSFVEMQPNPSLLKDIVVEGLNIKSLLDVMNKRIEILLDTDHCIGHAYFMPLKQTSSLALLSDIFQQKIMPLLQEYFFDNWERIDWVLNRNGMVTKQFNEDEIKNLFPKVAEELHGQSQCWKIDPDEFNNIQSYQTILGISQ